MQIENLTDLINKTNIRAFVTTNDFIKGKQYDKNKITLKSEKEKSNVTVTQRNTKEEKKIRNKIEKEGDKNRSGFKEFKL